MVVLGGWVFLMSEVPLGRQIDNDMDGAMRLYEDAFALEPQRQEFREAVPL